MTTATITKPTRRYDPYEVPANPEGSRFAVPMTPAGIKTANASEAVAHVWSDLARDRAAEAQAPEAKTIQLKAVVKTREGYELRDRGSYSGIPSAAPTDSGKFRRVSLKGAALIDAIALAEVQDVREDVIWKALLAACEQLQPSPESLRKMNDAVASLVLTRKGFPNVSPWDLPQRHL